MFKFVPFNCGIVNRVTDIATLEDIALGYLDDEKEARRVADIAGNMKFEDVFATDTWCLICKKED